MMMIGMTDAAGADVIVMIVGGVGVIVMIAAGAMTDAGTIIAASVAATGYGAVMMGATTAAATMAQPAW